MRFALLLVLLLATPAHAQLVAAVLPSVRSAQVGQPATAYATIINTGATTATLCTIAPVTDFFGSFLYQTTDPHTNQVTGTPNAPVDIPAGGAQTFVIAVTPSRFDFINLHLTFRFTCANRSPADVVDFVNTLRINVGTPPDIIPIAVTPSNDGIANIPNGGTGVIALAVMNIGAGEGPACPQNTCTCTPWVGVFSPAPSLTVNICETNPSTGACISALVRADPDSLGRAAQGLFRSLAANETATFSLFVRSSAPVEFDPAVNRINVNFDDFSGCFVFHRWGATSVAVRTRP